MFYIFALKTKYEFNVKNDEIIQTLNLFKFKGLIQRGNYKSVVIDLIVPFVPKTVTDNYNVVYLLINR